MRLFKKLSLLAFMTFLSVGICSTFGLDTSNKAHNTIENNVQTVANAQHFFDGNIKSAATYNPNEKEALLNSSTISCEISKFAYSDMSVFVTAKIKSSTPEIFAIGYYGKDNSISAKLSLKVKDANGNVLPEVFTADVPKPSSQNETITFLSVNYQPEITIETSIAIPYGTTVINESVELKNIFYVEESALKDDGTRDRTVHLENSFTKTVKVRKAFQAQQFSTFATFTPKTVTKYCGYYAVAFNFENRLTVDKYLEINKLLNPIFNNNKVNAENLKTGKTYVSTRIILTKNLSTYVIEDLDGVVHTVPAIPANNTTSFGDNNVVFNFPAEGINGVKNFYISKPMLTTSVVNKETNKEVASSSFSYRFGEVGCGVAEIKNYDGSVAVAGNPLEPVDADLIAILIFVGITIIFLAACLTMFFYKKNKYKDNEFKRVDPIAYLKTSIIAYIFFTIGGLDIYFLGMRCNGLNNSELFANPVDIIVIVFTLVTFLLGCFFIKKYYTAIKETIEKNRREKLNLNNKTEDDSGTISAQFAKTASSKEEKPSTNETK